MLEKMQQHLFSQHLHNEEPPLHHWLLPAFYEMNNLDFSKSQPHILRALVLMVVYAGAKVLNF